MVGKSQLATSKAHFVNVLFQISDTTFPTVVPDEGLDGAGVELDVSLAQPVGLLGLGREVSIGNGELFIGHVAADF